MGHSYVVTGGGRGVGRAIVERLLGHPQTGPDTVVLIEADPAALDWVTAHPAAPRIIAVAGDAGSEEITGHAADRAEQAAPLAGWVNNAAVFRDAWLHETPPGEVLRLVAANLDPVIVGCATAVRRFLRGARETGSLGAIVNVSSHQAQRAVRGALPYVTAKAATEGLTRALAVDYGHRGIRVNAVALGSIATERSDAHLRALDPAGARRFTDEIRLLQGRLGRADEVADVVAFLLSEQAGFVNGATVPVDGGRAALGRDPEER